MQAQLGWGVLENALEATELVASISTSIPHLCGRQAAVEVCPGVVHLDLQESSSF